MLDKVRVIEAFRESLRHEVKVLQTATSAARDEATSEESRPENEYDTRALEASYLAAGQGERLEELRRVLAWVGQLDPRPLDVGAEGALLDVRVGDRPRCVLLGPRGGAQVTVEGTVVHLTSVLSPLGSALRGLRAGDVADIETPRGIEEVEVDDVG